MFENKHSRVLVSILLNMGEQKCVLLTESSRLAMSILPAVDIGQSAFQRAREHWLPQQVG